MILHYGFELSTMGDAYRYGQAAPAADCATLKLQLIGTLPRPRQFAYSVLGQQPMRMVGVADA